MSLKLHRYWTQFAFAAQDADALENVHRVCG